MENEDLEKMTGDELYEDLHYLYNYRQENTVEFKTKLDLYLRKFANHPRKKELLNYINGEKDDHTYEHKDTMCTVRLIEINNGSRMQICKALNEKYKISLVDGKKIVENLPYKLEEDISLIDAEAIAYYFIQSGASAIEIIDPIKGNRIIHDVNELSHNVKIEEIKENPSFGGNKNGCYIATCVYGSYDSKEVWMLRRYRDYYLHERRGGRLFIKIYYAISPTLVKICGNNKIFKTTWKKILDKKIEKLKEKGYEDTPYSDLY